MISHKSTAQPYTDDELTQIALQLEAIIFASQTPVSLAKMAEFIGPLTTDTFILKCLDIVKQNYINRAVMLVESTLGYYFQVKPAHSALIAECLPERPIKLSQALLETLSIVAYKQPVTRGDIEYWRGVSINTAALKFLFEREWIVENGVRDVPGKPALLETTDAFLRAFNLKSLADLPPIVGDIQTNLHEALKSSAETLDTTDLLTKTDAHVSTHHS